MSLEEAESDDEPNEEDVGGLDELEEFEDDFDDDKDVTLIDDDEEQRFTTCRKIGNPALKSGIMCNVTRFPF